MLLWFSIFFQIPGASGSLILIFFFKYPQPMVLWFWFFFRVPATSGSLILIYSFECPQPVVITIIKDKPRHWSIPENESKLEPEWAGEGPFCKVPALLKQDRRDHTTWQNQPFIRPLTRTRKRSATKNTRGRVGSLPWPRWTSTYTGTFTFLNKAS